MRIADRIMKAGEVTTPQKRPPVEEVKKKVEEIQAKPSKQQRPVKQKTAPPVKEDQSVGGKRKAGRPTTGKAKALLAVKIDASLLASIKSVDGWQAKVESALINHFG